MREREPGHHDATPAGERNPDDDTRPPSNVNRPEVAPEPPFQTRLDELEARLAEFQREVEVKVDKGWMKGREISYELRRFDNEQLVAMNIESERERLAKQEMAAQPQIPTGPQTPPDPPPPNERESDGA